MSTRWTRPGAEGSSRPGGLGSLVPLPCLRCILLTVRCLAERKKTGTVFESSLVVVLGRSRVICPARLGHLEIFPPSRDRQAKPRISRHTATYTSCTLEVGGIALSEPSETLSIAAKQKKLSRFQAIASFFQHLH